MKLLSILLALLFTPAAFATDAVESRCPSPYRRNIEFTNLAQIQADVYQAISCAIDVNLAASKNVDAFFDKITTVALNSLEQTYQLKISQSSIPVSPSFRYDSRAMFKECIAELARRITEALIYNSSKVALPPYGEGPYGCSLKRCI